MSHATAEPASPTRPAGASTFLTSRLGSLLAVLPLGVWTVVHLWNNLAAFDGERAWESAVTEYAQPIAQLATALIVLLPLVLHAVWGIGRLLSTRPNNVRYGFYANFKYALQRITAIGVLGFLGAHIWLAMLHPRLQLGHPERFGDTITAGVVEHGLAWEMHWHMPTLAVYILGTLGVAYHLANGVQTFAMGWGVVSSRKALKRLEWVALGLLVILLAMGWGVIYAMYKAGGALPGPAAP